MTCPRCHAENRDGLRFCEDCGSRLTLTCAQCGGDLAPGKRFCGSCGTPATGQPAAPTANPESYTPKHLAEKILTSRAALEGERKQVTVLFADLKGSMELLADRDPEEARKLLDPVLERMMEAVHRYEGTVNQVMGDGIMALFGAPVAHEDHAVRACYAALDMQTAIRRYAENARQSYGVVIQVRVGLNSGEVVVRAIGSDLRMDYTAVGQTTHLAARMEQLAKPDTTLLTADTLRLAEGFIALTPLGSVPVKGLEAPVEVYELTGASPSRSRLQAAAARGLTRFVGRDAEVEQIRQALGRAGAGHGQIVAIVGEPGVGKSRLVWEVTHSHRTHGWLIVQASSVSYGKATPYLPVIDMLKGYFRIEDRDGPRRVREKVTGTVLTLDETLMPTLPAVLSLLDVPTNDPTWQALDPPQRRQRTLDAVKRLLFRESQVQPLVVVFEDLHWIDSETQALLDSLVGSMPTIRMLLLVNYRPEYVHGWGSKTYYTQLRLDALPPESAEILLHALLGDDATLQPIKALLVARTEGNPFFLEESVRTLVETGVLIGDRGAHQMTKAIESIQVPATLRAILAARIDRLAPEEKRLLQTSAVIGKDVPFALLRAIVDLPEERLRQGLTYLQTAEFLYETSLFPDLEYTFKHALTHEVAYGSLLQDRRRALHARIVEVMEAVDPERLSEQVDRLAYHAVRGEAWEKAITHLRQAGAKAAARSSNRDAVGYFEQALTILARLPETRETVMLAIDLRCDLRNSLMPLGRPTIGLLREAEALAQAVADRRRQARVLCFMTESYLIVGDPEQALTMGQRALSLAEAEAGADLAIQVTTNRHVARVYYALGEYRQAANRLGTLVATLSGDLIHERFGSPPIASVNCRMYLAWCLADLGDFAVGLATAQEGLRIAQASDHPLSIINACMGLGLVDLELGDIPAATSTLQHGLSLIETWGVASFLSIATSALGTALVAAGKVEEAIPLLEQAVGVGESTGRAEGQSLRVAGLAEAYLRTGRWADADRLARQALMLARQHKERGREARVLRLLGETRTVVEPADPNAGEGDYRGALAVAQALGMRPLVAHCHLGLGKLYRRTGDRAKAGEHLTTARAMYREMDMGFWLEKAETELGGAER
jgi:class 3 adenylate cyclase/tetratricopeptide (TPR) repeat protein